MNIVIVLINDKSEESDLDDIILITVTVVTKIVIVLMMIMRNIVLRQYYLTMIEYECKHQGWASCVSACHKEGKSVQLSHPDCGGQ